MTRVSRQNRPKILCLGMSYPCVESQMNAEGYSNKILQQKSSTVKQAIELVRRNVLTQMDGRDLARCRAMELLHRMDAYTVSQESGAQYNPSKHLQANFNRANFCFAMKEQFKEPCFRQVILDYFWIPSGTWMSSHWSKSFFSVTLPNLVKLGLLEYEPPGSKTTLGYGVVYLPFCLHCIKELIASLSELKGYYKISFLYKWELQENALWSGTSTINPQEMQQWLGKNINQEEIYCRLSPRDVFEAMEDAHITKHDILRVLRGIEDFEDVRMIRLTPLAQHNPNKRHVGLYEMGGFVGLLPPKQVQRGFDSLLPVNVKVADMDTMQEESSMEEIMERIVRKKIVRRRKRQVAPTQQKPRMYTVVPNIAAYCALGLEGKEKLTARYELSEKKRFRPAYDIETYHLMAYRPARRYPEPETNDERVHEYFRACVEILDKQKRCKREVEYNGAAANVSEEALMPDTRGLELLSETSTLKLVACSLVTADHASGATFRPNMTGLELLSETSALNLVGGSRIVVDQSGDMESDTSSACKLVSPSPERVESPVSIQSSTIQLFILQ